MQANTNTYNTHTHTHTHTQFSLLTDYANVSSFFIALDTSEITGAHTHSLNSRIKCISVVRLTTVFSRVVSASGNCLARVLANFHIVSGNV